MSIYNYKQISESSVFLLFPFSFVLFSSDIIFKGKECVISIAHFFPSSSFQKYANVINLVVFEKRLRTQKREHSKNYIAVM